MSAANAAAKGKRAGLTTYMTGIVHGLQPDALYVVIPALALPTKLAAVTFITMFVIGTCVSMGGYTLLIGESGGRGGLRGSGLHPRRELYSDWHTCWMMLLFA